MRTAGLDLGEPAAAAQAATKIREVLAWSGKVRMPAAGKLPNGELSALAGWARRGAPWPARHTRLTYFHGGRNFRLTGVEGTVAHKILV